MFYQIVEFQLLKSRASEKLLIHICMRQRFFFFEEMKVKRLPKVEFPLYNWRLVSIRLCQIQNDKRNLPESNECCNSILINSLIFLNFQNLLFWY